MAAQGPGVGEELAMLDRVLHRLVVTDDEKLSPVLDKLLPKLVNMLNTSSRDVRPKVVDVLSHVSKRARPNINIILPCMELLMVCKDVSPTSFAFNFGLLFLEMGLPRCTPAEQGAIAIKIAHGIGRLPRYSTSQTTLLNLFLGALENMPLRSLGNGDTSGSAQLRTEDMIEVTDWFLDIALYPGVLTREGSSYPGISAAGLVRLTLKEKNWPGELLVVRKLAVLRAMRSDLFDPTAVVAPALAAACNPHHEVIKAAEDLLKSISSSDREGKLQRDAGVAGSVLGLVLEGSRPISTSGTESSSTAASVSRSAVPTALAARALTWLEAECPEGTIARALDAVRVVFLALLGGNQGRAGGDANTLPQTLDRANTARLKAAGGRLAAFLAARCPAPTLPLMGPLLLQAVQRVLLEHSGQVVDGNEAGMTTIGTNITASGAGGGRGSVGVTLDPKPGAAVSLQVQVQHTAMLEACYEALASLAARRPEIFAGDTTVPRLLFSELSAKEPVLRVKISAALGALKGALASELWTLLESAAASTEHRSRLCAVEWACDLFPFSSVPARRLCMSLCDDGVTAVRAAATRGLCPPTPFTSVAKATVQLPGGLVEGGMRKASVFHRYPTFSGFVLGALQKDRTSGMGTSVEEAIGPGDGPLDLPPAALARGLDFAMECWREMGVEIDGVAGSVDASSNGQHGHSQTMLLHRSAAIALWHL
ncbi:unnamed protein product, partial [Choristocarpus tenellus]